ncbi:MAG: hypothetical protein KF791_01045 [Verrucomicrobiae bacterium]|nr:hypothetical protein [Verrucomicrobiae bacterium]
MKLISMPGPLFPLAVGIGLLWWFPVLAQQPGALDSTYRPPEDLNVGASALQEDGRMVVASPGYRSGAPRRLLSDGSVDSSFEADPEVTVERMTILGDGRIVLQAWTGIVTLAPSGVPDPTHSTFGRSGRYTALAASSDGGAYGFGLLSRQGLGTPVNINRLRPSGAPEPRFNWRAHLEFPASDEGVWVSPGLLSVLDDGRIVVGGGLIGANGQTRIGFARFDALGYLDPEFDPGTALGLPLLTNQPGPSVRCLSLQDDGRLVTAFSMHLIDAGPIHQFARLLLGGGIDESFTPAVELMDSVDALGLLPDGSMIVSGRFRAVDGQSNPGLARLGSTGRLDPAFIPQLPGANPRLEAVQPDGRLLVTVDRESGGDVQRRLIRLEGYTGPAVKPLIRIGPKPITLAEGEEHAFPTLVTGWPAPALQWDHDGVDLPGETNRILTLPRLTPAQAGTYRLKARNEAGAVEAEARLSLGVRSPTAGRILPGSGLPQAGHGIPLALLPMPDGSVWVGGHWLPRPGAAGDIGTTLLLRLKPDGSPDAAFPSPSSDWIVHRLLPDPSGRIYVAGDFQDWNGYPSAGLVRLWPNGTVDDSFRVVMDPPVVRNLARDGDGTLLVCGNFRTVHGIPRPGLVRLRPDGTVVEGFRAELTGSASVYQVSPSDDGSMLVSGIGIQPSPGEERPGPGLVRLDGNGHLLRVFAGADNPVAAFLPGPKPIIVGFIGQVYRLLEDGTLDTDFRSPRLGSHLSHLSISPPLPAGDDQFYLFGAGAVVQGEIAPGASRFSKGGDLDRTFALDVPATAGTVANHSVTAAAMLADGNLLVALVDSAANRFRIARIETRADRLQALAAGPAGVRLGVGIPEGERRILEFAPGVLDGSATPLGNLVGNGFVSTLDLPPPESSTGFYRLRPSE